MNMIKSMRPSLKLGLLMPLVASSICLAPHARAESILLAQTTLVNGTVSTVDSFTVPTAGKVTVNLQGLAWPTTLSALSFSATSADHVFASWSGSGLDSGSATFDVAAGTYFAHIVATAGGALDLGLYSLFMTFTPSAVPLPSSGWLLLTGMLALAGLVRVIRPSELMGTATA
jgi:hypothetical protein